MFNPHPYDDTTAVNRPLLNDDTIGSIVSGIKESAKYISDLLAGKVAENPGNNPVLAFDGYMGAQWDQVINLISQNLLQNSIKVSVISFKECFKPADQLDEELKEYLPIDKEKDPVSLYGKLFKGGIDSLLDSKKLDFIENDIRNAKIRNNEKRVTIVHGIGCTLKRLRPLYDSICYFDLAPKQAILRARKGVFPNLGDATAKPVKVLLRRCYYIDFEVTGHLRWELLRENAIDLYIDNNDPDNIRIVPKSSFNAIMSALVKYPMRCKPVYLEGVWGGHYVRKLRNLPENMKNLAWVFDLIPLEVSIVVEAGKHLLEFPFFTFVQKEGTALMGAECVKKFDGYFPIRFNYDDTYHSSGNMSIQVHSGHSYNVNNYGEHGRQDESYYVVATGHGARTFIGFQEGADPDEFLDAVKKSEKDFTPVDYEKYVNYVPSKPGTQFMLPAGTIHSSGRNQVVLEIGSLSIGSYTYKLYDYLRADLDGIPRPIHTYHGERVLRKERTSGWVRENLVQEPQLVRKGENWAEYIVGQHDLLYFSLRRLEFEKTIEDDTNGKFHVLTLVDGESLCIQSIDHPERCYTPKYLDMVIVPANMGRYIIRNLGNQPVCVHKTMLKDGFEKECIPDN